MADRPACLSRCPYTYKGSRSYSPSASAKPQQSPELRKLIATTIKVVVIAKKLKRSPGAVDARINSFKKTAARFALQCAAPLAPFRASRGLRESGGQQTRLSEALKRCMGHCNTSNDARISATIWSEYSFKR
jgi:hypothetical protein